MPHFGPAGRLSHECEGCNPANEEEPSGPSASRPLKPMRRLYLCLGYGSIALAVIGLALPLLPTTPFLLLAIWCFARSSPERVEWLYEHPRFGGLLSSWRDEGAIPLSAKISAVGALGLSYMVILWTVDSEPVRLIVAVMMAGVALYVVTRPRPGCSRRDEE